MSEETLKATNIKVLRIRAKDNPKAPVDLEVTDLDTSANGWMKYWPTLTMGKAKVANPACKMVQGGEYRVGVFHQTREWEGKTYTDWYIKTCDPLATTADVEIAFGGPDQSPPPISYAPVVERRPDERERSIMYQSARKDAAVMHQGLMISMGTEAYTKEFGSWLTAVTDTTEDFYQMVVSHVKHGHDPFAGE